VYKVFSLLTTKEFQQKGFKTYAKHKYKYTQDDTMMNHMLRRFVSAVDTYPVSMAAATVGTTTMTGMVLLNVTNNSNNNPNAVHQRRPLTMQEAHFRAMIDSAQESTWQEKWETAAMAQEQLMMPENKGINQQKISKFVQKINARSKKLMQQDQDYWSQRQEFEKEQTLFATTTMW